MRAPSILLALVFVAGTGLSQRTTAQLASTFTSHWSDADKISTFDLYSPPPGYEPDEDGDRVVQATLPGFILALILGGGSLSGPPNPSVIPGGGSGGGANGGGSNGGGDIGGGGANGGGSLGGGSNGGGGIGPGNPGGSGGTGGPGGSGDTGGPGGSGGSGGQGGNGGDGPNGGGSGPSAVPEPPALVFAAAVVVTALVSASPQIRRRRKAVRP